MTMMTLFQRQMFDYATWTYTYLIADLETRDAALIDTVKEQVDRDIKLLKELELKLRWVLDTHVHADHITGAEEIRQRTGAHSAVGEKTHVACANKLLMDGEQIPLGNHMIKAIATPGHTDGCMSYFVEDRVFTGDALFIRGCGRTDFQQGNPETLYKSITEKLYSLPETTKVYPGHDYQGFTVSTIGEEKLFNPRISEEKTMEEFVQTMNSLKLAEPKKIHMAVPANLTCGRERES